MTLEHNVYHMSISDNARLSFTASQMLWSNRFSLFLGLVVTKQFWRSVYGYAVISENHVGIP